MKFFFATAVFILFVQIYWWSLIFVLGIPKLYKVEDIVNNNEEYAKNLGVSREDAIKEFSKGSSGEKYIFEINKNIKADSVFVLASLMTFLCIFLGVVIFYKRSYLIFPLITAIVFSFVLYMSLWIFSESIPKTIYLDIFRILNNYPGILALKFIGTYVAIFCLILMFSNWYRLHEK